MTDIREVIGFLDEEKTLALIKINQGAEKLKGINHKQMAAFVGSKKSNKNSSYKTALKEHDNGMYKGKFHIVEVTAEARTFIRQ